MFGIKNYKFQVKIKINSGSKIDSMHLESISHLQKWAQAYRPQVYDIAFLRYYLLRSCVSRHSFGFCKRRLVGFRSVLYKTILASISKQCETFLCTEIVVPQSKLRG